MCPKGNKAVLTEDVDVWPSSVRNYCSSRREARQGRTLITLAKVMSSQCWWVEGGHVGEKKYCLKLRKVHWVNEGKARSRCWLVKSSQRRREEQVISVHTHFGSLQSTCCKAWRRWPSPRLCRWCGWRPSQPAVCWSRSGSRREWSSWGVTWGTRSTVSPAREASRRGRSCKPWPPEGTPPKKKQKRTTETEDLGMMNFTLVRCYI